MELLRVLIGPTLRRERRSQGRTLKDVADAARVSITHLSEVERGRKEVSSEVLEAICAALGLSVVDVLETIVVETRAAQRPLVLRSLVGAGVRPSSAGRYAAPAPRTPESAGAEPNAVPAPRTTADAFTAPGPRTAADRYAVPAPRTAADRYAVPASPTPARAVVDRYATPTDAVVAAKPGAVVPAAVAVSPLEPDCPKGDCVAA